MSTTIICPQCSTLILHRDRCPSCSWVRPPRPSQPGVVLWEHAIEEPLSQRVTTGAVCGDTVCVPGRTGLHALDTSTGTPRWSQPVDQGGVTAGVFSTEKGFLLTQNQPGGLPAQLQVRSVENGGVVWSLSFGGKLSAPAVYNQRACCFSSDRKLLIFDLPGQKLLRTAAVPAGCGWVQASPWYDKNMIVLPGGDGIEQPTLAAALHDDGRSAWTFTLRKDSVFSPVVSPGGIVCLVEGLNPCQIRRFDLTSGHPMPPIPVKQTITARPTCLGDYLYVGVQEPQRRYALHVFALKSGEQVARFETQAEISVPPVAQGRRIYVCDNTGTLYALNRNALLRWKCQLAGRPRLVPVICGDQLITASETGTIQAVSLNTVGNPSPSDDPETLLQRGEFENAAVELAIRGDFHQAGEVYRKMGRNREAAVLFREAGDLERSLQVAQTAGLIDIAAPILRQRGDIQGLVQLYHQFNQPRLAAKLYEEQGDHRNAARSWEQAGEYTSAAYSFLKAGEPAEAGRAALRIPEPAIRLEVFLRAGNYGAAAEMYDARGDYAQACENYQAAGRPGEALNAAQRAKRWEVAAELAMQTSDLAAEADARQNLGQMALAADRFEQAGQALAANLQFDEVSLPAARLFERALQCLNEREETPHRVQHLRRKIARCGAYPILYASMKPVSPADEIPILRQYAAFDLSLHNFGWGKARDMAFLIESGFSLKLTAVIPAIGPGDVWQGKITIRPEQTSLVGINRPVECSIRFVDMQGRENTLPWKLLLSIAKDLKEAGEIKHLRAEQGVTYQYFNPGTVVMGDQDNREGYIEIDNNIISMGDGSKGELNFCNHCRFPLRYYPKVKRCPRCDEALG